MREKVMIYYDGRGSDVLERIERVMKKIWRTSFASRQKVKIFSFLGELERAVRDSGSESIFLLFVKLREEVPSHLEVEIDSGKFKGKKISQKNLVLDRAGGEDFERKILCYLDTLTASRSQ